MGFNFKIGFTQWTPRQVGENLPKQIWGRKDKGLRPDVGVQKEEILDIGFNISYPARTFHL
jgi:hypothetical protein